MICRDLFGKDARPWKGSDVFTNANTDTLTLVPNNNNGFNNNDDTIVMIIITVAIIIMT